MPDLVSVLMPVRDAGRTLGAALESVRAQTHEAWELIVVDDGSTDATTEILAEFARRDRRVRVVSTPPLGIARALQTGCATANGKWIARMDADDVMDSHRLAAQLDFSGKHPQLGVVSCRVGFGGDASGYSAHVDWLNRLESPGEITLRRFVESPVAHPSVMFRRELLELHGGYRDGDFPEDYELWLRWLDAGVSFGKVPRQLLLWNDTPGRLSRTDPRYSVEGFYKVKCEYLAKWLSANLPAGRELWLWGAGRVTRRRFDPLERRGFRFTGFIDIDPKKAGRHRDGRAVIMAADMPPRDRAFVLVGVGTRGARERIAAHLAQAGWIEGTDFLLAA